MEQTPSTEPSELENLLVSIYSTQEWPDSIKGFLVKYIPEYLRLSQKSLMDLSNKTDVNYDTLLGIKHPKKHLNPTFEIIVKILSTIVPDDIRTAVYLRYYDFMRRITGEFASKDHFIDGHYINEKYGESVNNPKYINSTKLDKELKDEVAFNIFSQCGCLSGMSGKEIQNQYGNYGLTKVNILVKKGFLIAEKNENSPIVYRTKSRNYKSVSVEAIVQNIRHGLKKWEEKIPDKDVRYLSSLTGELDVEARSRVKKAMRYLGDTVRTEREREQIGKTKKMYINFFSGAFENVDD